MINSFSKPSGALVDNVTAYLRKVLSRVADRPLQSIDANAPIETFGVRAILQMTNELEKSLGWLRKTLYFERPNLAALAEYFAESYPDKFKALLGWSTEQEKANALCEESKQNGTAPASLKQVDYRQADQGQNIAIVGLACRFPYARNMHEFWDNLRNGRDCIEEIPRSRWDYRLYFDEERNKLGKTYGKWGGFIEGFDQFDPLFFNITPREAEMMDPLERVFLQCVYSAVEDAGYTPTSLSQDSVTGMERPVGVYVGLMFEEYNLFRGDIYVHPSSIANRISYFCNFHGPSMAVDTMCSSALTAIHLACQSLKQEECSSAIVGGVNLTLHPNKYLMLARIKMISPKGRCRAFGAEGDGYVPAEGVGTVVLKTLSNALADGDHIYGVIQATAINQSGKTRGYFVPNPNAQADVISRACETAGINPRIITYVEAHGTGTSLGDPIEIAGLTKAYGKYTQDKQYCAIGSVKSNIGHCEGAAGIAGLTKVLLQMKHGQLAPSLHSERLNSNINFEETPFRVQQKLEEWERPRVVVDGNLREYPRIAGISSFGAGGVNAHIVVEAYQEGRERGRREGRVSVVLSAKSEERLLEQARQLLEAIEQGRLGEDDLWDMAYTLQLGREAMEHRLGMTAGTMREAAEKLRSFVNGAQEIEELCCGEVKKNREMAAAFRGDEDLVKALESCLKKGKTAKLLELWTKGVEIDWGQMYLEGEKPRRVSLPTYPFARERYWVEGGEEIDGRREERGRRVLHPLVQRNSSRLGEQRYSSRFSGEEFFLAEHVVNGQRMMPGVAYLEMARAAIEQAWPERPEAMVLELRNTVWAQPIVVDENKQISIVLSANDNDQIDYEIYSQEADQEIVHCHGYAVWTREPAPARIDLAHLKSQMGQSKIEARDIYAACARMGIDHGHSLQSITAVYRGSNQVLAQLRLPRAVEEKWEDYLLHPSLMDGALQATVALMESKGGELLDQTRLPFALDSLRIVSPCGREMVAWVRYTPGSQAADSVVKLDIDLCDELGNVCAQMQGFSSRVVKSEKGIASDSGMQAFVPVWNPIRVETHKNRILPVSAKILILGSDQTYLDWVQQSHPNAYLLPLPLPSTIEIIEAKLKDCSFDRLLWIAPDVARFEGDSRESDDEVIGQQESGVLSVFRIIKALLRLGYGDKELRWTLITGKTQRLKKDERIQPAHAAIFGLVGSLAKEYPHWTLTLLDVDRLESATANECLSIAADKRGNGLVFRGGEWFRQEFAHIPTLPQPSAIRYRQNGVYVVIGGAGGLGEVWSRFMVEHYQANIIWIGRRPYDSVIAKKINSLTRLGLAPLYISADAANPDALEEARKTILRTYPAIHGVIHSAIVLHDQSIARMEESEFRSTLSAKLDVSVNIDRVFGDQELDFMLFFSSIMSFAKSSGQSNYAAGCTFKDSFAQKLQQQHAYPVKIINWGYWGNVGIVAGEYYNKSMERIGIGSIEPDEGMASLQTFLDSELNQMGLVKMIGNQSIPDVSFSESLTHYPKATVIVLPEAENNLIKEIPAGQLAALETETQNSEMNAFWTDLLASTLISLGLFRNGACRIADVSSTKQPAPFYERWLNSTIHYLQQQNLLTRNLRISKSVRTLTDLWLEWENKRSGWAANSGLHAQIALVEICLKALPDILSGKQLATDVIFPLSSMRLVEGIYRDNAVGDYFNQVLGETLSAWMGHKLDADKRQKVRILEIGAGTGGTTTRLLPMLQRFPIEEYCYTDVSKAFLMYAEEQYQPRFSALTTSIFDVSKPLALQSITPNHYDVVIATNVLHATPNIRETLRNAKAALKSSGILLLNEISIWSLFTHLTFGLLEGWWLHEDTALRLPGSPALAPERWREVLAEEGFQSVLFPVQEAHRFGQQVIAASSDGWVRQRLNKQPAVVVEHKSPAAITTLPAPQIKESVKTEESLRERSVFYFQKLVASTLKMQPDQIEPRRSFAEYGLDSILVGQLTYQLRQIFSDVTATLFFEVQSIAALTDYFLENKKQELVTVLSATAAEPQMAPTTPVVSDETSTEGVRRRKSQSRASVRVIAREHETSAAVQTNLQQNLQAESCSSVSAWPVIDVAIIGVSGRYPRSNNLKEFWMNLSNGINCIAEIPKDRWNWKELYDPERGKLGKIYSKWGGFIDDIGHFDPTFFKISPKEAKRMDPQERLFLESCYHAIEDAGYTPESLGEPEKIGVFAGVMNSRYTPQPAHSSIANRVSYHLDFQGPSLAVDTACSSSLTAIHMALESIYSGLSSCAIAGGVNLIIDPVHYLQLAEMTMLSSGNQCKAFGECADGLVDAEGVGAVVLKPLKQAQHDGDHIYAVIKGSAINAGGKTNGYTVPNPQAQARLVSLALQRANITAEDLTYIEAHGTGTALGDPIEIAGLTRAFRETSEKKQFCSIGSLKSNIGHCESAAGIAGLTKVLLQLKYGQLVPSLHADVSNPEIDFGQTPFKVQKTLERWQRPLRGVNGVVREMPRMAGISSFGAGGSNAHVIVQEHLPPVEVSNPITSVENAKVVIVLSAKNEEQLRQKVGDLLEFIGEGREALGRSGGGEGNELERMAYTLQVGREGMEERLGVVVRRVEELEEKLGKYVEGEEGIEDVYRGQVKGNKETVGFFEGEVEGREAVEKWIGRKKVTKLVELWVKGLEVEWSKLYGERKPRRMSLPVYPFARERYWIEGAERGKQQASEWSGAGGARRAGGAREGREELHPLVQRNTSDLREQRYSSRFRGDEFFLADHEVVGKGEGKQKVMPAVAYLEMARAAVEQAWRGRPVGSTLELRDTVWAQPVVVRGEEKEIHIGVVGSEEGENDGANHNKNDKEEIEYEIYTEEEGGEEVVHCQGRARVGGQAMPARLNVEQLKAEMRQGKLEREKVYEAWAGMGMGYGRSMQAIRVIYCGSRQVLAELRMPEAVEEQWGEYVLHPSMLDGGLQASVGLMEGEREGGQQARLPFALDELRIVSRCTREMYAWVRYAAGGQAGDKVVKIDIDLCDEQGKVCAQMRGVSWQAAMVRNAAPVKEEAAVAVAAAGLKENTLAAVVRKEIEFLPHPPVAAVPDAPKKQKRRAIALAAPSAVISPATVATSAENAAGQSSAGRALIALSAAAVGVAGQESMGPAESSVRLFDCGQGIFSIQIAASGSGRTQAKERIGHLRQALERVRQEGTLKVLLLSGLERCLVGDGREEYNEAVEQKLYEAVVLFPYPVIGVLQGDVKGAGLLAAALCDLMVCNEEASYGYSDVEKKLYPTAAEAKLFSERFGEAQAQDLLYVTGTATGKQLRGKGWTCAMVAGTEVEAHGQRLAAELGKKSQEALGLLKRHLTRRLAGMVKELTRVEVAAAVEEEEESGGAGREIVSAAGYIELETPAEKVLLIKIGAGSQKVRGKELVAELRDIFEQAQEGGYYKAIVLVSEGSDFVLARDAEEAVGDFQRLIVESEIPVVAAVVGDARGAGWLSSQFCDGCVYSQTGVYSAGELGRDAGVRQAASAIFVRRMGSDAGKEILLSGAEYTGAELQRRIGGLLVVEQDQVVAAALGVAEFWSQLPRATLVEWKKQTAASMGEKIGGLAGAAGVEEKEKEKEKEKERREEEEETRGVLGAGPATIELQSKVVRVRVHGEGIVEVKLEDREAKNMFSEALVEGVKEAFGHIEQTAGYKVVVLSGYDSYFASGGTKESLLAIQAGQMKFTDSRIYEVGVECKLPVIAAMQGHGIGAGWTLGMMADVAMLSEESRYVSPYMNYGFTPGAGASWVLGEKMGEDVARESLLTGQVYGGRELKERGVGVGVKPRAEVYEAAMGLARQIARSSRGRLQGLKQEWSGKQRRWLEETYGLELAMHEKTFVGRAETREQIEENFYEEGEEISAGAAREQVEAKKVGAEKPRGVEREIVAGVSGAESGGLEAVTASLRTLLANELQMRESDIEENVQFLDLGLDSISGVTWVRKINEKYQTSIEATKVYSHPTLGQLSRYVKEEAEKQGRLRSASGGAVSEGEKVAGSEESTPPPQLQMERRAESERKAEKLSSRRRRRAVRFSSGPTVAIRAGLPEIAVIGMAGQFPQARNLEEFWQNIAQGKNCITQVPAERWDVNTYYQAGEAEAGKTNSRWMGALEEYDRFDPLFFNLSPTEAESMDPQQRLFLQACWHSIEDAGYDARVLSGSKCGVFAGCAVGDYHQQSRQHQLSAQGFTGGAMSILAARISYFLNLQGPCISIDTACSSSLVAIAHACESLVAGSSDLALAGGVYVMGGPEMHIKSAQAGMLSGEGKCYSFDQRANGFVPGEGVGVVVLKRLAEAERDGDIIYGVLQGWGVNQDGKSNGITAPNPEAQARLEQEVYDKYGIDPAQIELMEAHGTGTKLGDPIEVEGLKKAFGKYTEAKQYCALGSVKSNIGHCLTAAGVAGLIKLLLALKHKQLPPTINFEQLNEHIELKGSPFYVNRELQEWELRGAGRRRQGAVSSFGFSGTNAHVVVGEYVGGVGGGAAAAAMPAGGKAMIALSARTGERLKQKARELWEFLGREGGSVDLGEMAYTLQVGREAMEERVGFVVSSVGQLAEKLEAYIADRKEIEDCYEGQVKRGKESLSIISQDAELRDAMVSKWMKEKKLSRLLELWVKGLELDWNQLYGERRPRRMNLPVYPFAKERYWIEAGADRQDAGAGGGALRPGLVGALHPLVHVNTSDLNEQRYSSTFTGDEFFLTDHQVALNGHGNQKILPGVAYLEMARAAIEQASPVRPGSGILELHNVVWLTPFVVTSSKGISITVLANDNNQLGYEIYSIESEQRSIHCQGEAVFSPQPALARLDIERLRDKIEQSKLLPSSIYSTFKKMGLNYGPSHRGITAIYLGENQLLAQLKLPAIVEASRHEYVLHPSLMDSALQASIGLIVDSNDIPSKPSVPFALESVRIVSTCVEEMVAWVRYSKNSRREDKIIKLDIDLCDLEGNICIQMQGFSARILDAGKLSNQLTKHSASETSGVIEDDAATAFDSALYQTIIGDILNHQVSVDEAAAYG
jgi:acyl transferase domain-containing protein/enoyl-CoA hydratase/carnithine racemase/acyl carrier protein/SAM-dependent methyltransferase